MPPVFARLACTAGSSNTDTLAFVGNSPMVSTRSGLALPAMAPRLLVNSVSLRRIRSRMASIFSSDWLVPSFMPSTSPVRSTSSNSSSPCRVMM